MAKKTDSSENAAQENISQSKLISIEELKVKHKISNPVYAGLKVYKKWAEGKKVTEKEFLEAIEKFLGAPIDNKVVNEDAVK